jgi:type I restriction enzyme S subunit
MSEWREVKLGEIVKIISGGTPKTNVKEYWNGDIPWLSVVDFNNTNRYVYNTEKSITNKGLNESSTKILKKGQLIISARGTVGALAQLGRDMAFNQSCYGLDAISEFTFNDYLYYLVKWAINKLKQQTHGAVFDTITRETFDYIDVLLPPLSEQKVIASVLGSLDDKIDLLHRNNQTLEAMAETIFRQWFIEEADKFDKCLFGDEFDIVMGQSPPGNTYNEVGDGIVFFQGRSDFGFRFPTERVYCTSPKRIAKRFDVLLSVRAPVGDINMAMEECCIGRGLAAIRHKKGYTSYAYYKAKSLQDEFGVFEREGTVFGAISKSDLKSIKTTMPSEKLIRKFEDIVNPIDRQIYFNTLQIRTLESLRDTLLPKLITGEIRVPL